MSKLYLLGDSTCADKTKEARPETGWGEAFIDYMATGWIVENRAHNGFSTKSCMNEGVFGSVLLTVKPGDAAILQFGHNDEKLHDPRGSEPYTEFVANLKYMAGRLKEKGVDVYFVTQVPRRIFRDGVLRDTHSDYTAALKFAAHASSVPYVDITIPAMLDLALLGEEASKRYYMNFRPAIYVNYPEGKEDNTHLRPEGAAWVAGLVAKGLAGLSQKPAFLR